jgi:hypothetical protein
MSFKRSLPDVAWVFVFALVARLGVLSRFGGSVYFSPSSGDMKFYADWGRRIAAGHWSDPHAFYGLPGYAFLIGNIFKLAGFSPYTIAFLQTFSEAAIAALIFLLALWAYRGSRARIIGALAALGWVLFQPAQAFSLIFMPTTWGVLAFWGAVLWSVRSTSRSLWKPWAAIGVLIGGAATLVATVLLVLPIAIAAAARNLRKPGAVLAATGFLLGGVAVGTSPCWYHNCFVAREPVFLSAHGGLNFWIGNNPDANGYPKLTAGLRGTQEGMLNDSIRLAETAAGHPLSRAEVSRYWSDKAHAFIAGHPVQWLGLMAIKVRNLSNATQYDDLSVINPMWQEGVLTPGLRFGPVAVLAIAGLALAWRRDPQARWIALAVALSLAAVLPVFVTERYRLAAVPGLLLLAAGGLTGLGEAVSERNWKRAGIWLGAACAGTLVAYFPIREPTLLWLDDYNSGLRHLESRHIKIARALFQRALAHSPQNPDILTALGTSCLKVNDLNGARRYYGQALQIEPKAVEALNNLAIVAAIEGRWAEAIKFLETALQIEPDDPKMAELRERCRRKLAQIVPSACSW